MKYLYIGEYGVLYQTEEAPYAEECDNIEGGILVCIRYSDAGFEVAIVEEAEPEGNDPDSYQPPVYAVAEWELI